MLKSKIVLASLMVGALLFTGCATRSSGMVGETIDVTKVDFEKVSQMKKGTACSNAFLGIAIGTDTSLLTAASNGGIKKVHYVEESTKNFLFFVYDEFCINVYGE